VLVLVECLVAEVAAVAEPSLVVLQVLRDLIQENPWVSKGTQEELECQPFPVGTR